MRMLFVLGAALLCAASCAADDVRSPVFAWGSSEYIQPGQSTSRVSYQVLCNVYTAYWTWRLTGQDVAADMAMAHMNCGAQLLCSAN